MPLFRAQVGQRRLCDWSMEATVSNWRGINRSLRDASEKAQIYGPCSMKYGKFLCHLVRPCRTELGELPV